MKIMIYHHGDEDGWASAASILKKYPESELTSCYHKEVYNMVKDYDLVFVVDFTFDQENMDFLKNNNKEFIWIDHHISAMEKIKGDFEGIQKEGTAGCELTWRYLFPNKPVPAAIEHIAGEDIWDFSKPFTKEFMLFLQTKLSKDNEPKEILELINTFEEEDYKKAYELGTNLTIYQNKKTKKQLLRGVKQNFLGEKAMVFFSNTNASNLGNLALVTHKDIEIAVIIDYVLVNGSPKYKFSLRSRQENGVNVAKMAQSQNGGGHHAAAGFESEEKLWENN